MTQVNNIEPARPFPPNAWTREQALRHVRLYPKVVKAEGESDKDFKKRLSLALRDASVAMRKAYRFNTWRIRGQNALWYDGDQVVREFEKGVVAVS